MSSRGNDRSSSIATGVNESHAQWYRGAPRCEQLTEHNQVLGAIIDTGMGPPAGMIDNIVST